MTSLHMESRATGLSTTHLYLPIRSQARPSSVTFAPEKLKREPLWTQRYVGPRREVETHSIRTRVLISADRTTLMCLGPVLSRTLSGLSAKTGREIGAHVSSRFLEPHRVLPRPGGAPLCTQSGPPRTSHRQGSSGDNDGISCLQAPWWPFMS